MPRSLTLRVAVLLAVSFGVVFAAERPTMAQQRPKSKPAGVKKKQPAPVKQVTSFDGFSDWVVSAAFSPDGKLLAAGGYEVVKIYDVAKRKEMHSIRARGGYVRSLIFSADGAHLVGGHYQGITIWDSGSADRVAKIKGPRGYVTGLDVSPDGKQLVAAGEDGNIRFFSLPEGDAGLVVETGEFPANAVGFSPDGTFVAVATGDENRVTKPGFVTLYNAVSGKKLKAFPEHAKSATDVVFSEDGKFLISTSVDETVNVYEVESGKALGFFGKHSRPTTAALFLSDGQSVVSSSGGRAVGKNEVKFWNRADGGEWGTFEPHKQKVTDIALSPDGKYLATTSVDKTVALWDLAPVLATIAGKKSESKTVAAAAGKEQPKVKPAKATTKAIGADVLRAGIIGLDTSHAIAFTKLLNAEKPAEALKGIRMVAVYPKGSPDIETSTSRVPDYTKAIKELGVEVVDSIPALLQKVDVVFLETNDGRPHFEQVLPVFKAGKPVFIDKPIAGSLTDAVAIFEAGRKYKVPVFSSSSLRFTDGAKEIAKGKYGKVIGCDAYSPCSLEKTHPSLFWYGIHGVETLFTVMGPGCESVTRASTTDTDFVTGIWKDGRIGTFRGLRSGKRGYGGQVFGDKGNGPIGGYSGYQPLVEEIVTFFRTGKPPVTEEETLDIYAFMEAADESQRQGGAPVTLESVLKKARAEAAKKLAVITD